MKDNVQENRELWDQYEQEWNRSTVHVEDAEVPKDQRDSYLQHLGDEWGTAKDAQAIVDSYILPYLTKESTAGEIGVGGGRIASKVVDHVKKFYAFDVSQRMLKRTKSVLKRWFGVKYCLLEEPALPENLSETFDFIYSFDVMVHIDLHTMWRYFQEISRVLKKGGHALVHTSNLLTEDGFDRFSKQKGYSVAGFYFVVPEIVHSLAERAGLKIIKTSSENSANVYERRDYLAVLEK